MYLDLFVGNRQFFVSCFFFFFLNQPPLEVLYQHSAFLCPNCSFIYKNVSWCSGIGQFLILSPNTQIFSPRLIYNLHQLGIFAMTVFFTYKISKWSSYVTYLFWLVTAHLSEGLCGLFEHLTVPCFHSVDTCSESDIRRWSLCVSGFTSFSHFSMFPFILSLWNQVQNQIFENLFP